MTKLNTYIYRATNIHRDGYEIIWLTMRPTNTNIITQWRLKNLQIHATYNKVARKVWVLIVFILIENVFGFKILKHLLHTSEKSPLSINNK